MFLVVFFTEPAFFDWAFERHQNLLSWVVRPLLVLPLCYAAWRRSLTGIFATILAILTSMFWFPVPDSPAEEVSRFLAMERSFLTQGWTRQTVLGACAVLAYAVALVAAFWRRSWSIGFAVAAFGALLKGAWSLLISPEAGQAVLPFASGGVIALGCAILVLSRRVSSDRRNKSKEGTPNL
ncbi:MAG: hypothetical protein K9H25_23430 [Rhodospirillum sp.]|nr:hypothetical protein [Rhodospirillum sp.]MCF8492018.1 hypothetical protein [Rhodospirillum sp.]MCF8502192.1 hypothetical protein [Rhodospirillum sp.]